MTRNQIYKCRVCGNVVEVVHVGGGTLVCCDERMQLMEENIEDASTEKHVPVVEETNTGIKVKVGSVPHPMEASHFIEWIEVIVDGQVMRQYLKPGDAPEAEFPIKGEEISVREYCNLHGLWARVPEEALV